MDSQAQAALSCPTASPYPVHLDRRLTPYEGVFLPRAENITKYCHEHSLLWRRDGAKDGAKTEKTWRHKAHQSI